MVYILLYLSAIIIANLVVVRFGPTASVINAFLFIGLDLTARDRLHDAWHNRGLWWKMTLLIATGSVLSYALVQDAKQIAIASFTAFALAGAADTFCYHLLGKHARHIRINGSNVVSASVDSIVFPVLAFGWPPLWGIIIGQFIAKVLGGFVWSLIFISASKKPSQAYKDI